MTSGALNDHIRENRRFYLSCFEFTEIPAQNRTYTRKISGTLGSGAGEKYRFLGLSKTWTPMDYVKHVIEPLYIAGYVGSALHDAWAVRCRGKRCSDPRVKAFLKAAQDTTDLKGAG